MVALTQDAQGSLDRYMRQVKATLRGHRGVDPQDVERDILGHIQAELAGEHEPVTAASLGVVLERLGSPAQWVPSDELPIWRRVLATLRDGPEDWRLAYLTFALLFGGPVLASMNNRWDTLGVVMIAASYFTARATLSLLAEHGDAVGARRWLIYPPLVLASAVIGVIVLAAPAGLIAVIAEATFGAEIDEGRGLQAARVMLGLMIAAAIGVWWMMLGLLLNRFTHVLRMIVAPFADGWERRHGLRVSLVGLVLALGAGAGLFLVR